MNSNNSVNLSGNVGRVNYCPPSGDMQAALFFSVGITRFPGKKDDQGNYDKTTDWTDCVIYGKRAEKIAEKSIIDVGTGLSVLGSLRSNREEFVLEGGQTTSRNINQVIVEDFQVTRYANTNAEEPAAAATA